MKRGIVIGPRFELSGDSKSDVHGSLNYKFDLEDLRFSLLFWDILDFGALEGFMQRDSFLSPSNPELDLLLDEGLAINERVPATAVRELANKPLFIQDWFQYEQLAAVITNNQTRDEEWSVFQTGTDLWLPKDITVKKAVTEFELYNLLPIPSGTVPLYDVLEFRERRMPELLALRDILDSFTSRISSSQNPLSEAEKVKDTLVRELANYHRVVQESNHNVVWKSLTKIASDDTVALTGIISSLLPLFASIPATLPAYATIASMATSTVRMAVSEKSSCDQLPESLKNYAYLLSANNELV